MVAKMQRKGNPLILLVGMQAGTATLENNMEVPQKVKNRATLTPNNCTTSYLPKIQKCSDLKGNLHPNVHSINVHNSQTMERVEIYIDRWMNKEDMIHTMGYYSAIRKDECTIYISVDGSGGYCAE